MSAGSRIPKLSEAETRSGRRMRRHFEIGFRALFVPFMLSGIILAGGRYLSTVIAVDENSVLFWLWPFNRIYLKQFVHSPYSSSEIKWFFTVVSCSNLVWLIFLVWKFGFELFRRDVEFPSGKTPVIDQVIIRGIAISCFILTVGILGCFDGFNTEDTFLESV